MAWRVLFSSFYPPPCFQQHWRLTSDRHCTGGTVPVSHPNLDIIPSNILRTNKWKLNRKINWQKKQTKKQCYRQKLFKSNLSNGRKGKGIAKVEDVKSKLKLLKGLKSFSSQGQRVRKEKDSSQILSLEKGSSLKLLDIGDLEVKFSNSGMSKDSSVRRFGSLCDKVTLLLSQCHQKTHRRHFWNLRSYRNLRHWNPNIQDKKKSSGSLVLGIYIARFAFYIYHPRHLAFNCGKLVETKRLWDKNRNCWTNASTISNFRKKKTNIYHMHFSQISEDEKDKSL